MTEVFANTYTPPEWLDEDFLQAALREGLRRGSLNILDCNIFPATNKGDNFVSQMFRASTTIGSRRFDPENFSVVIKSLPFGEAAEKFVRDSQLFEKEIRMLSKTLPMIQEILNNAAANFPRLFAKLYFKQGPPRDLIILEDLCQCGYKPANRLLGLDQSHCILVVEALATFHAASQIAIERKNEMITWYKEGIWRRSNEEMLRKFMGEGMKALADFVPEFDNLPPNFSKKLAAFEENVMEKVFCAFDLQENDFNVLTHGDSWTNNFMFKYENDSPVSVKLVDFQLSHYNNPVIDLLYFIFTSPNDEIQVKCIDTLLKCYHEKLVEVCEKLNHPISYSYLDLRQDFIKRLAFGFAISITVFPFTTAQSSDVVDLNEFLDEDKPSSSNNQFTTLKFKNGIRNFLPYFIENGVFD